MNKKILLIIVLLTLIGAFLSTLLLLQHYSQTEASALVNMLCGGESTTGCDKVNHSSYASVSGLPLAAVGIIFYLTIGFIAAFSLAGDENTLPGAGKLLLFLTGIALVADLTLLGLQAFSIGAFCIICISTYVVTAAIFALLLLKRKQLMAVPWKEPYKTKFGRMMLTSWITGSLLLTLAVLALNYALSFKDPAILDERLTESAYTEYLESPVRDIDLTGIPYFGKQDAPIKVVIFSDFLCPYCRQMAQYFQQNLPHWRNQVVLYYVNYPLDQVCNVHQKETIHEGSCWVALGGICADQQGKFWVYHDYVYNKKIINPGHREIIRFGRELGLDTTALAQCLFSNPLRNQIRLQIETGFSMGVTSTPRVYIDGRILPKTGYLSAILKKEAERLGVGPLPGLDDQ